MIFNFLKRMILIDLENALC